MRVLLVHPHDVWSPQEPWTIRILQLARCLRRMGHDARVAYFPRTDEPRAQPSVWRDVPLIPLDRSAHPWSLIRNTLRLIRLAGSCDVLHLQKAFHWAAVPTLTAAWIRRKPLHYDWDDWELEIYRDSANPASPVILWWLGLLERWLPQLAQTVSVASERLRQEALAVGVPADHLWWAPVGADPEEFHPQCSAVLPRQRWGLNGATVLYVGQLHGGQYVELVLKAAALTQQEIPSVRVLIVGDGYQRRELERLAAELKLSCVTFVGAVPREEVPAYVAAADVCVAAFEANPVTECKSPLKIAEYLAAGKPIVASDVGEVSRMIGESGVLVPPGNAEELAAAILRLLNDPSERQRLGCLARARATTSLNWMHTAQRLTEAYDTALATLDGKHAC